MKVKNGMLVIMLMATVGISLYFGSRAGALEGADAIAEEVIMEIAPEYEPWFDTIWEPPSGEIESALFAVQAAAGGIFIGYFIGSKKIAKRYSGHIKGQ
jgi:cobalt/nickel transport protein